MGDVLDVSHRKKRGNDCRIGDDVVKQVLSRRKGFTTNSAIVAHEERPDLGSGGTVNKLMHTDNSGEEHTICGVLKASVLMQTYSYSDVGRE